MAKFESFTFKTKTGSQVEFRNLEGRDAEKILNFRRKIASETKNTMQYVGMEYSPVEEVAKRLTAQLDDETTLNIAVFDGEELIAHLNFRRPKGDHPWASHVGAFGMMILKSHWGLGVGKKMLEIQDEHAKKIGVVRIESMVRTKNERGIALYKSCGFQIEGTSKMAAFIDNEFEDEHFIAKISL